MTAPAKPNAELAYRVLDHIDAHPEQWRQEQWISRPDGADCGTAGCFAGWASMLSGDEPLWEFSYDEATALVTAAGRLTRTVGQRALELLGITYDQKVDLFHQDNTREDLGRLVEEIFGPRPTGAGCRCDWLGEGTPEHAPSPLCRSLRPDVDRTGADEPRLIEGDAADEQRDNAYARYEADEARYES